MPRLRVSFLGNLATVEEIGVRSHAGKPAHMAPYRTPKCRRYPPNNSSGPCPTKATLTSWRARWHTKYIGTMEEAAMGSSSTATILGSAFSNVVLVILTLVC